MHFQQIKVGLLACALAACGSTDTAAGRADASLEEGEAEAEAEAEAESEAESEVRPDQKCPEKGCKTDTVCQEDEDCPADEPCRMYECDLASATCRYWNLDQDGDGFVPEVCGGTDCNDDRNGIHPGAQDSCAGLDRNCDGQVDLPPELGEPCDSERDQDLCAEGVWECREGGLYCAELDDDNVEVCNGSDDDCDGRVDGIAETCGPLEVGICRPGTRLCTAGKWGECGGAVWPEPEEEFCADGQDSDCDGEDDPTTIDYECNPIEQTGCSGGMACLLDLHTALIGVQTTYCSCSPGDRTNGESCSFGWCAIGLSCAPLSGFCRQICDTKQPMCPDGTVCAQSTIRYSVCLPL